MTAFGKNSSENRDQDSNKRPPRQLTGRSLASQGKVSTVLHLGSSFPTRPSRAQGFWKDKDMPSLWHSGTGFGNSAERGQLLTQGLPVQQVTPAQEPAVTVGCRTTIRQEERGSLKHLQLKKIKIQLGKLGNCCRR